MKRSSCSSESPPAPFTICTPTPTPTPTEGQNLQRVVSCGGEFLSMMMEGYAEEDEASLMEEGGGGSGSSSVGQKKRRLSIDQVKALEKSFDIENKLEPEKKQKLAEELGLQPRQVSVWFQNRRARWRNKVLEKDFTELKTQYDELQVNLGILKTENDALLFQIQNMKTRLCEEQELESEVKKDADPGDSESSVFLNFDVFETPKVPFALGFGSESSVVPAAVPVPADIDVDAKATALIENSDNYETGAGFEFLNLSDSGFGYFNQYQVKTEEYNFLSGSFFGEIEQFAPNLHWFNPENWK